MEGSTQLIIAGSLNFIAAALHIAIIFGGPQWYRFFGAGEEFAQSAESGKPFPAIVTIAVALVLAIAGIYAFSGAGIVESLPFLKAVLVVITSVYLTRGVGGLILPFIINHPSISQNSTTFWIISSVICCILGFFHLLGTISRWEYF